MGFALCRFSEETGCGETGSRHYIVHLPDINTKINVPEMWKHYMLEHLIQPNKEEREAIMNANPQKASGKLIRMRSAEKPKEVNVMYVEKTDDGYSHEIGMVPDYEFIRKLESILSRIEPLQTKGIRARKRYRRFR